MNTAPKRAEPAQPYRICATQPRVRFADPPISRSTQAPPLSKRGLEQPNAANLAIIERGHPWWLDATDPRACRWSISLVSPLLRRWYVRRLSHKPNYRPDGPVVPFGSFSFFALSAPSLFPSRNVLHSASGKIGNLGK